MNNTGAGTLVPSEKYGAGTSVPSNGIEKNGTKVPAPEGYKHTKVGVIPEDWDVVKLKNVLSKPVKNGYSPICPEEPNENWILSLGALSRGRLNINNKKPAPLNDKKVKDFLLKDGDFLISRSNTPDRVGFSGVFRSKSNNHSYPDLMMRFRVDESQIAISFLEYYLKSSHIMRYLQLSAAGSSSTMVKINKKIVENIPVIICAMKEQQKIAQILTSWDDAISKQESLIKAKEKLKKGLMQSLLQGKRRFRGFNDEWEQIKINYFFEKSDERVKNNSFKIASIGKYGIRNREDIYSKELSKDYSKNKVIRKNQIAFGMGAQSIDFGVNLSETVYCVSPAYKVFTIKNINQSYFGYLFSLMNRELSLKFMIISARQGKSIDFEGLLNYKVHLPFKEEQQKIAEVLTLADKEIELLKNELEALKEQKRGLMQKLLTGEVRVVV